MTRLPVSRPFVSTSSLHRGWTTGLWLGAALLAGVLLAACGGGSQTSIFIPTRVLAFGDEASVVDTAGRKYTVNAVSAANPAALDCAAFPIWVQTVATARYGLVFPECNPNNVPNPASRILAQPGARVADVVRQVDTLIATGGGFRDTDLSLVMAGANDILDAFARYPATPIADLVGQVSDAGRQLGLQINRMADGGSRVIVSTVIDLTYSPFGRSQPAAALRVACPRAQGETEQLGLMECLVNRFNGALRTTFYNDGRRIGLVLGDELVRAYVRAPQLGGFNNVASAACAASAVAPQCTSATLAGPDPIGNAASPTAWLWADGTQLSPGGHAQLGASAASRAATNPF